MKKIMLKVFLICSLFVTNTSFTAYKKEGPIKVKVIVRIDRLKAISKDACNAKMDFKGAITIHTVKKSFPVMEGNDIRPGWEFSTPSAQKFINIKIDIWDDDDALCGGGDDAVIVNPTGSQTLSISLDPNLPGTKTTTVTGKKVSGKEQAEITYTTTIISAL
ncbi:hypothetical protein [Ferruginibacter sp.]|nr:hypothetical protein [Ferruginibacter sp.]